MADIGPLVTVHGFRELQRLFAAAGPETRKETNQLEREVAEPVRRDAEGLAGNRIPKVTLPWAQMRVGVTRNLIYVAPKKRGTKAAARKRPTFARLMDERVMTAAAVRNQPLMNQRMELLFAEFSRRWNGIL